MPVDLTHLHALVGDDPAIVRDLLEDYVAAVRQQAGQLLHAHAEGDLRGVASVAHKLKSSSRSVGAMALGAACAALETAGHAGQAKEVDAQVSRFSADIAAVESHLSGVLDELDVKVQKSQPTMPMGMTASTQRSDRR